MIRGLLNYGTAWARVALGGIAGAADPARRERLIRFARGDRLADARPDWTPAIPAIPLSALGGADRACLPLEDAADGNVSALELAALGALASRPGVKSIFEIGTFNGLTALNFALNSAADARIFTLDLPPENKGDTSLQAAGGDLKYIVQERKGWLFHQGRRPEEAKITQLFGDSATFDYAAHRNATDLVFVDGAHSYDYVRKDTETALQLLRNGRGVIAWHDYNTWWPGVIQHLEELYRRPGFDGLRRIAGTSIVVLIR